MSKCISRAGEYSEHVPGERFTCTRCGVFDEEAAVAKVEELQSALGLTTMREPAAAPEIEHVILRPIVSDLPAVHVTEQNIGAVCTAMVNKGVPDVVWRETSFTFRDTRGLLVTVEPDTYLAELPSGHTLIFEDEIGHIWRVSE